jgi:hypothetical protein
MADMRIKDQSLRGLIREALTFKRLQLPGRKGTFFDRDARNLRAAMRGVIDTNRELPDDSPQKRTEEDIRAQYDEYLSTYYDLKPSPVDPDDEEFAASVRAKKAFDKGSEVAKGGYKIRYLGESLSKEILYWSKDDEVSCMVFRSLPVDPIFPISVLLVGGTVTFADFSDIESFSTMTPSGRRRYPNIDLSDRFNPSGQISPTWDDVERRGNEQRVARGGEPRPAGQGEVGEALVRGSFPEAVVVSGDEIMEGDELEEVLADLERVDLPLVDVYLRPITIEGARKILTGL